MMEPRSFIRAGLPPSSEETELEIEELPPIGGVRAFYLVLARDGMRLRVRLSAEDLARFAAFCEAKALCDPGGFAHVMDQLRARARSHGISW